MELVDCPLTATSLLFSILSHAHVYKHRYGLAGIKNCLGVWYQCQVFWIPAAKSRLAMVAKFRKAVQANQNLHCN